MKKPQQSPRWINSILDRFCDPLLLEGLRGDLDEIFAENLAKRGPLLAKLIYLFQALGFLRMTFKKKDKRMSNMKAIWSNYFLTTYRSAIRQKTLFAINLTGLVLAISCSLFAYIYLKDELGFDKKHRNADHIYRLYKRYVNVSENIDHFTYETSGMMGPTMKEEYPEVEDFVRVLPWWHSTILTIDQTHIETEHMYFADSNFFQFFDFDVLRGNASTLLTAPSSIVLSESLSKKLFGDKDPIGQQIIGYSNLNYTVTGIFQDVPSQSSMQFDAVVSWSTTVPGVGPLNMRWMNNWLAQGIFTFVQLAPSASSAYLEEKLSNMMQKHFAERADQYFLKLQQLTKMHLYGENIQGSERLKSGSYTFVLMLAISAIFILLIASVNYINIALSKASRANTEVGIRKVLGSTRRQLIHRFIAETFVTTVVATLISCLLLATLLPSINQVSGKELPIGSLFQWDVVAGLIGFILVISISVGFYPSIVISRPPVSSILKSSKSSVASLGFFRKVLLTIQYTVSILLIICTVTVIKQTDYLLNKPLGVDQDQVLILNMGDEMGEKVAVLESRLLEHPDILSVSVTRSTVGDGSYTTTVFPEGYNAEFGARIFGVDQEFFETYGVELSLGRTFTIGSQADSNVLIVNQALVEAMGWENPIGKHIRFSADGEQAQIIGVIKDFHIHSVATDRLEPMIIYLNTTSNWFTAVKIGPNNVNSTLLHINEVWDDLATRTPFDYYFLNEWFERQYKKERQLLKISSIYSVLSLILCTLGLYGLTALILQQRSKEMSLRKVLGASLSSIIQLVNRQFIWIIIIGFAVAAPIGYLLMGQWLSRFAYSTNINANPFLMALVVTLLTSLLIISILTRKTANRNPAENLTTE